MEEKWGGGFESRSEVMDLKKKIFHGLLKSWNDLKNYLSQLFFSPLGTNLIPRSGSIKFFLEPFTAAPTTSTRGLQTE